MKTIIFCLTHVIFLGSFWAISAASGDGYGSEAKGEGNYWTVIGEIPQEEFVIQLHRGAGIRQPENTLEACEFAWDMGAVWDLGVVPEVDLRTTSDGVIVAFHDTHFNRVVKNPGPNLADRGVIDFTFEELQDIEVGSFRGDEFDGQRIPRIEAIFDEMRDRPEREIYLDIKDVDLDQLAQIVREYGVSERVIFTTTHHNFIREWKAIVPESQSLNWIGGTEERVRGRLAELRKADFEGITQLQIHVRLNPDESSPEPFNHSQAFIRDLGEELRERGILFQVLPWELAEPDVFRKLLELGVASFATDYPEETVQAVRAFYGQDQME